MQRMTAVLAGFALLLLVTTARAEDTNVPGRLIVQANDTEPTCSTAASDGELCVEGDAEVKTNLIVAGTAGITGNTTVGGTLGVTGASTLTGNTTVSGTLTVTGASTMNGTLTMGTADDIDMSGNQIIAVLREYTDKTTNYTVAGDDCGQVLVTDDDTRVFTLPDAAAANKGCEVTFVVFAADDAALVSISPHSSDGIQGGCCYVNDAATTACAKMAGTADKDLQCTKAEQNLGDTVTLVSDGAGQWYITSCYGPWVTES